MEIFEDLSEVTKSKNTVLTLGTFDGIHLGHKKLFIELNKKRAFYNGRSFVVTFHPHPRNILSENQNLKILTTPDEKAALLNSMGIQNLLIINFTKEFSRLSPEDFFRKYIIESIGICEIIIGSDHHFGKGRGGNVETLMKLGAEHNFKVTEISEFLLDNEKVSSSKIREALNNGLITKANKFLGRYYSFSGFVVEGDKRGRTLGFPTANIRLDYEEKLLPALGIYLVEFVIKEKYFFGLLSIGKRPTFYNEGSIVPEVYIYDFDENIYGETVTVNLIKRLRGEERFNSAEELIMQMNKDKKEGIKILNKIKEKV
jgi:riboflavin kinase/FMN adenylyltransferase